MTDEKPWGKEREFAVWTEDELSRGEERLRRIISLLPQDVLVEGIRTFYADLEATNSALSLGDPSALLQEAESKAIMEYLRDHSPVPDEQFLQEEAEACLDAICRYWVNVLLDAWQTLRDEDQKVLLSRLLLPEQPKLQSPKRHDWNAWEKRRRTSMDSLYASLPINHHLMSNLTTAFCRNVERTSDDIELPDGVNLVKTNERHYLQARN